MGGENVDIIATVMLESITTPVRTSTETKTQTKILDTTGETVETITPMRQKGTIMAAMVVWDVAHTVKGIIFFTIVMTLGEHPHRRETAPW